MSMRHRLPSASRPAAQSLDSGVVPELLMRDMISLRFSGVNTSAISPRPRLATQPLPPAGMRRRGIPDQNQYTSGTFGCGCSHEHSPQVFGRPTWHQDRAQSWAFACGNRFLTVLPNFMTSVEPALE